MKKLTAFMFSGFGGKLLPQSPADVLITDLQFLLQSLPTPLYDWHTNRLAWFLPAEPAFPCGDDNNNSTNNDNNSTSTNSGFGLLIFAAGGARGVGLSNSVTFPDFSSDFNGTP